ncbi:MAG: nucleotidyl transferase AbiEii/AbiGii toxin family protein [Oceanipulchritudo sp.]|jgi:hypothetical protein
MDDLIQAAREVQDAMEKTGLPFCFIGGLANLHWGEPRLTRDLDLTVLAGWGNEGAVTDRILREIQPRMKDARAFALENRVLLLQTSAGVPIDLALGALPFEESATKRAKDMPITGIPLRLCSAEDLVVMKAFANRPRDWSDVEGILMRQKGKLDMNYILEQLASIAPAKPEEEIMSKFKEFL